MLLCYHLTLFMRMLGRTNTLEATFDMLEDAIEQQTPYISDYF